MQNNKSLLKNIMFTGLIGVFLLISIITVSYSINQNNTTISAAESRGYSFDIYNFTPNDGNVKARIRIDGNDEQGGKDLSFITDGEFKRASTTTLASWAPLNVSFEGVKDGYVPAAILATKAKANEIYRSVRSGKTFKQAYIDYCATRSEIELNDIYGPIYIEYDNWEVPASGIWFEFRPNPSENLIFDKGGVVLITGVFPADENAVSMTVSAPSSMKIGSDNLYSSNLNITATVNNNASYPIYIQADFENAHLSTYPDNNFLPETFRLEVDGLSLNDKPYFVPARKSIDRAASFYTVYTDKNGLYYFGQVLVDNPDFGTVDVQLKNYTYLAAGEGKLPDSQTYIQRTTHTEFAAADYNIENIVRWQLRANPSSVTPGMLSIDKDGFKGLKADDIDTALYNDSFDLSFIGKNMDRVERIVIVPRGNTTGHFSREENHALMKNVIVFTDFESIAPLNGGGSDTPGWKQTKRSIKQRSFDKINISVNIKDLIPYYDKSGNTSDNEKAANTKSWLYQDSLGGKNDYLDIYLLCADESAKPVQTTQWSYDDPKIINNRTSDFSLPLSHKALSGSGIVNTGGTKVGGNYLAIVRTNFANNKPLSSTLSVTDSMTAIQSNYKAIVFTGVDCTISFEENFSIPTWKMSVSSEVKVNEYLRILPQENLGSSEAYIKIEQFSSQISISTTNCKLMADKLTLFYDFTSTLDQTSQKYWYSNQFDKINDQSESTMVNMYNEDKDIWSENSKFHGTDIKPSQMQKIKFIPKSGNNGDIDFDIGILKGGIKSVYPYAEDVGLTMDVTSFDFLPDFIQDFLNLNDWNKVIEEVRYPYTGDLPQISTGDGIELNIGGNFLFFEAGAGAALNINTLWEERNVFSVSGYINLFDKLKVMAELTLSEYGDKGLMPDKIFFSAGSDMLGLIPPIPFLEISEIGGSIENIGKTFAHQGWNYIPPLSVKLMVAGSIGIPGTPVDIGFGSASLTVGANIFEIKVQDICVGPLTISEELTLKYTGDFSKGVEIPGTNGFKLSMPVFEISGSGNICLAVDGIIPKFADGSGSFSFKFDGAKMLESFIRSLSNAEKDAATFKEAGAKLKAWASGDKDMVDLTKLLKELGFDYASLLKDQASEIMRAFQLSASLTGEIYVPEIVPGIGGSHIASGEVTLSFVEGFLIIHVQGKLLNFVPAGFTLTFDLSKDFKFGNNPGISVMSFVGDTVYDSVPVVSFNLTEKTVSSGGSSTGVSGSKITASPTASTDPDDWNFTTELDERNILVSIDMEEKAAVSLNGSNGDIINITTEDNDNWFWVELYDRDGDGIISDFERNNPFWRVIYILVDPGDAETKWTVTCSGLINVTASTLSDIETVESVIFDGSNTISFELTGAKDGIDYKYEIVLISSDGSRLTIKSGDAAKGVNHVTVDGLPEILAKLQSGDYMAAVTIFKQTENGTEAVSYAESTYVQYTNSEAPNVPIIKNIKYIGDGFFELMLADNDPNYGYELYITGTGANNVNERITLDYMPGSKIIFGAGLSSGNSYAVYTKAYRLLIDNDGNTYKIFSPESKGIDFNVPLVSAVNVDVDTGEFKHNQSDNTYYIKMENETDKTGSVVFSSNDCVSYSVTIVEEGSGENINLSGSGILLYEWLVNLTNAARYTVTIDTINASGDSSRSVFKFVVDGTAPIFVIDTSSVVFDGNKLTFDAYLEPWAKIDLPGGTWSYNITDANDRAATGDYSGTWSGNVNATVKIVKVGDEGIEVPEDDLSDYATVYELLIPAIDFAGNETEIQLLMMVDINSPGDGEQQLILDTTAGNVISKGMDGLKLIVSAVIAPSFTEQSISISELDDINISETGIIELDSNGNITVIGTGTVIITGYYEGLEAKIVLTVYNTLPLGVSVESATEDSITVTIPPLPGFVGALKVRCGDKTIILTDGFDKMQTYTFSGLKQNTSIMFTHSSDAYESANIYFTVPQSTSISDDECTFAKCPDCGGCMDEVCCCAGDCVCLPCECDDTGGLSVGAIIGIIIGSVALVALTGLAIYWFAIKKNNFTDIAKLFKKTPKE